MAGSAFKDPAVVKVLAHFTPILVDGDTEKEVCRKYGASGYPTTVFADTKGEAVGRLVGAVPVAQFLSAAEGAVKKAKAGKPSPDYAALAKAQADLDTALEKKTVAAAFDAIGRIEKVNRPGDLLDRARSEKERLLAEGRRRLDEAKAALEKGDASALKQLRAVATAYKGTDLGAEAAKLAHEAEETSAK